MKTLSNNQLFTIAVISIIISFTSIAFSFGGDITGAGASTDVGFVNVTVGTTAQITVWAKSINFTGALGEETRTSYEADDVETIDQLPCDADSHCGMNITNDGNQFINVTIQETENLFTGSLYTAASHFLYNVTMQDSLYTTAYGAKGNCSVGYDQGLLGVGDVWGAWRAVPRSSAEVAICYLNHTDDGGACEAGHTGNTDVCPDTARVEFNITVPLDETAGEKAGTITFTAGVSL